jgi:hypothetical protein
MENMYRKDNGFGGGGGITTNRYNSNKIGIVSPRSPQESVFRHNFSSNYLNSA